MGESLSAKARISSNHFARQWEDVREDALAAVERVGRSGRLVLGEEVAGFERELASWWGTSYAVGVASGVDALEIGLRCAGIEAGSRVLTTPLTAFATTLAIIRVGAEPVWCDIDDSGGLDLDQAETVLVADPSIRAVVPVHLYGHPLDPEGLEGLSSHHGVKVVEDCAQSAGAERCGRSTGVAGVAAATSLYPTKNLGAMGDGGVLLTDDEELAEHARVLRDYGRCGPHEFATPGLNSRLDELHAAILRSALLPRLDRYLTRRREIARRYSEALADSPLRVIGPVAGDSSHHLFPVEVVSADRDAIVAELERHGIAIGLHYPRVCPDQPAALGLGTVVGPIPVARGVAERQLSLPINPYLDDHEVEVVIDACAEAAS